MAPSFIHLRLHSEYSIVDGIVRLEAAVAAATADDMPALALTDLSNVFGLVKFYEEARGKGVKPIIGCDFWLENEADRDKSYRGLLLCQSRAGYLKLCDLLTRAYRTNQYRGRPELKKSWFAEGTEGLIALSGAHHGDVGQALAADNGKQAQRLAREDRFRHRHGIEGANQPVELSCCGSPVDACFRFVDLCSVCDSVSCLRTRRQVARDQTVDGVEHSGRAELRERFLQIAGS